MLDTFKQSLLNQYLAALSTLRFCIERCPEEAWAGNVGNFPFWHVAYHALFYGDFYLTQTADEFSPPPFHRENYNYFDRTPKPPHAAPVVDVPYERDVLLGYVEHCREKAQAVMVTETAETLTGPSGFDWYPVPRAEFWVINLRHVHHHAAQLSLYLRNACGVEVEWVGSDWRDGCGERNHTTTICTHVLNRDARGVRSPPGGLTRRPNER